MDHDRNLDCAGLLCPLPVLRARKVLLAMERGQRLCIRTTDKMALIDLPHFCTEAGHHYLSATEEGPVTCPVTCHVIERG